MPKSFFPLERGALLALLFLIVFSAVAFLPVWGEIEIAGMVVFGWLMAALMVISPALLLFVFRSRRE